VEYTVFGGESCADAEPPRYMALVVGPDGSSALVLLDEAGVIDPAIENYRSHMFEISRKGRYPSTQDDLEYRLIADRIRTLVWDPIAAVGGACERVFISPDGALSMVSFATLTAKDGPYLIDRYAFHYLLTGRDVRSIPADGSSCSGLLALGDPDFDATLAERQAGNTKTGSPGAAAAKSMRSRGTTEHIDGIARLAFDSLPATRDEVNRVARHWSAATGERATVYCGPSASEARFRAEAPGKCFLHLATHAFSLASPVGELSPQVGRAFQTEISVSDPLMLCGLFLAGGNRHGEDTAGDAVDDGILTAAEIAVLPLFGTRLVVLSACESGLGPIQLREGIYGLRRAFQLAGVRSIVSSLWPVPDEQTASMMEELYRFGHEPLFDRMRRAQIAEKERLESMGLATHPYAWGAFVASGGWQ
jgi:CHAT domain-containing protein